MTWATTTIDNSVDSLLAGAHRFDPSVAYDATGNLYIAYGVDDGTTNTVLVARSDDIGATFSQVTTIDAQLDALFAFDHFNLATGADGLGHQAVYVAYRETTVGILDSVEVAGSNNNGATFTAPAAVNDSNLHLVTTPNVSVGPHGELYVSWYDANDQAVRLDRDLDGLFVATNTFGSDITVVDQTMARPTAGATVPVAPDSRRSSARWDRSVFPSATAIVEAISSQTPAGSSRRSTFWPSNSTHRPCTSSFCQWLVIRGRT